jgi:hypothetical protein
MPDDKRTMQEAPIANKDFARMVDAIARLNPPTTLTTVVEPPPLEGAARDAAETYATIAASLRTVFESFGESDSSLV